MNIKTLHPSPVTASLGLAEKELAKAALERSDGLAQIISSFPTPSEALQWMLHVPAVEALVRQMPPDMTEEENYVLALAALLGGAEFGCQDLSRSGVDPDKARKLLTLLMTTHQFYHPIGGLLGYYQQIFRLLVRDNHEMLEQVAPPPVHDMRDKTKEVWSTTYEGIHHLTTAAEVYTVGGSGDRLQLISEETSVPLPVARLLFLGRSLLEGLFRDLAAREYWHYLVFGEQVTVPVILMTSQEKNNDTEITKLCEPHGWFGRPADSIFRIVQPLVPAVTLDGKWACSGPLEVVAKPGGHGVLWKLAQDSGAFDWLAQKGISSLIVRQINNPLAGTDHALSSLLGFGCESTGFFGFASCPRRPGLAEGINVLMFNRDGAGAAIANVEYTQFEAVRKRHAALLEGACPANTNILFVDLEQARRALRSLPIPGMVVNAKTSAEVVEHSLRVTKPIVRLESMMQGLSEGLMAPPGPESMSTFLCLYDREKIMSVTKRASRGDGRDQHETPESCLYDWGQLCRRLLGEVCGFQLPEHQSFDSFLAHGLNFSFCFHPALGPLWDVIGQKISGGELANRAELELELAEVFIRNLVVDGCLRVLGERVMGIQQGTGPLIYTRDVGRAFFRNVTIQNKGLQADVSPRTQLRRSGAREGTCTIQLLGASEVIAEDLCISGDFFLTVPDGIRARLEAASDGSIRVHEEPYRGPSWEYDITWSKGSRPQLRHLWRYR